MVVLLGSSPAEVDAKDAELFSSESKVGERRLEGFMVAEVNDVTAVTTV